MIISTAENIPGRNLEVIGLAKGNVVRAKHIGKDIMAGFKAIVGGEIKAYTELMYDARAIATDRMVDEARNMRADAITCVRYETSSIMDGSCEVMAYGTAVRFV